MPSPNISFNPNLTQSPQNSFLIESQGYVQGVYLDDPTTKNWLESGVISSANVQPLWGGLPIDLNVPSINVSRLGLSIVLATAIAGISGFTVFNQAYNGIITPGSNVPQYSSGMNIAFFKLGTNARIAVPISAALAIAVEGGSINQSVTWNFSTNQLDTYVSGTPLPVKILYVNSNSKIINYDSTTGTVTWTDGAAAALIQI